MYIPSTHLLYDFSMPDIKTLPTYVFFKCHPNGIPLTVFKSVLPR